MKISDLDLLRFVMESNAIEGIHRAPTDAERDVSRAFLHRTRVTLPALTSFVHVCAGAKLRDRPGMNVRVADHLAPPGGPDIKSDLEMILKMANAAADPYTVHCAYEKLHPFMDGNGRSGRILWAWQMTWQHGYGLELGFLHLWYYQSLSASRG